MVAHKVQDINVTICGGSFEDCPEACDTFLATYYREERMGFSPLAKAAQIDGKATLCIAVLGKPKVSVPFLRRQLRGVSP